MLGLICNNHCVLRIFADCQLLVGAKHWEDKLSVIAKNSSPNASPVQLSVVSRKYLSIAS
ncbi:MAG: hypothetical protein HEQ29_09715 [Dolichospermum sp. LBC05a]|nr:hypothetical protein [Dolichospermum sp. OL01]MCO5797039.1 hypothetical protein [Dolichospermum sp. OL03]MCS6280960.1 hypothetical protein [Dolichospermum sp.]QSV58598.1 MAG: hypothetical protein HEQ29_09715 [Dolichospermum sp. LBC05a]